MLPFYWDFIALGALGGLLPDILRAIKNKDQKPPFQQLLEPATWQSMVLLAFVGALTVWLLSKQAAVDAIAFGFGAPEILSNLLAKQQPSPTKAQLAAPTSIRGWWSV